MFDARVTVKLKRGVSDPEGKNTEKALHLLGFDQVEKVSTFRIFDIQIDENDERKVKKLVEEMCERLLTNPVIHNYDISLTKYD